MKVSQLIEKLQFAQKHIGDVDVKIVEVLMNQECYEDEVYLGIGGDNDCIEIGVAKVEDNRLDRIMKEVVAWADENEVAVANVEAEVRIDVEMMLIDDEYKNWTDEQFVEEAIECWKMYD